MVGFVDAINIRNYEAFAPEPTEIVHRRFRPEVYMDVRLITPAFSPLSQVKAAFARLLENELHLLCRRV